MWQAIIGAHDMCAHSAGSESSYQSIDRSFIVIMAINSMLRSPTSHLPASSFPKGPLKDGGKKLPVELVHSFYTTMRVKMHYLATTTSGFSFKYPHPLSDSFLIATPTSGSDQLKLLAIGLLCLIRKAMLQYKFF